MSVAAICDPLTATLTRPQIEALAREMLCGAHVHLILRGATKRLIAKGPGQPPQPLVRYVADWLASNTWVER